MVGRRAGLAAGMGKLTRLACIALALMGNFVAFTNSRDITSAKRIRQREQHFSFKSESKNLLSHSHTRGLADERRKGGSKGGESSGSSGGSSKGGKSSTLSKIGKTAGNVAKGAAAVGGAALGAAAGIAGGAAGNMMDATMAKSCVMCEYILEQVDKMIK